MLRKYFIVLMFFISGSILNGCNHKERQENFSYDSSINQIGNTSGNLSNSGEIAKQGDYLYFSGDSWNPFGKNKLFRMNLNDKKVSVINSDNPSSVNVVGNWIYYIGNWGFDGQALYKIKTDGTEKKLIDTGANNPIVVNGWIYYKINNDDKDQGKIIKMNLKTLQKTRLDTQSNLPIGEMIVLKDHIYYTNNDVLKDEKYKLYSMTIDGKENSLITEADLSYLIGNGNTLYFYEENGIYKMKIDGTNKLKVTSESDFQPFNLSNNWLYYINRNDHYFYKMKTDGKEKKRLTKLKNIDSFYIFNGEIYFYVKNHLYCMTINGNKNKKIR